MGANNCGDIAELREIIREFVRERDWDQTDSPKNLAAALCVEAAELLEPFIWLINGSPAELTEEKVAYVKHEIADVFIYLIALADKLDVDLFDAVLRKMDLNRLKYPVRSANCNAGDSSDSD